MTVICILAAVVLIIAVWVIFRLLRHGKRTEETGHRPVNWVKPAVILLIIGAIAVLLTWKWKTEEPTPDGDGVLHDFAATVAPRYFINDGDEVNVAIHLDQVTIGRKTYTDISEISDILYIYYQRGCTFRISDDFALNSTYTDVMDILTDMGVDSSAIEFTEIQY